MTASNPAALQGWVKSTDPKTGRVFFANHITRKTQWTPPDGWVEEEAPPPSMSFHTDDEDDEESLPGNWDVMHDPTTGKAFYVDHETKITTWTRPKKERQSVSFSLQPAIASPPTSGNASAALSRMRGTTPAPASYDPGNYGSSSGSNPYGGAASRPAPTRSYQEEMAYYSQPVHTEVDLSDSLPFVEFSVHKVADALRPNCPHCDKDFTMRQRRHHCRLCGDVFCDACSNHRVELPLEGAEFEKGAVRVCDFCFDDVDAGNFFSLRRYLTPLTLWSGQDTEEDSDGVATANNVNAALSGLTQDLESRLQGSSGLESPVSIPPPMLIPVLVKPLANYETVDRAVRCIAALLAWEALTGGSDYVMHVYDKEAIDRLLDVLERSGSDRKTLYVQEQAARIIFYLTESKTAMSTMTKEPDRLDALDMARSIRNVLDHATNDKNANLQRWAAASLKNLVVEDQRRACLAVNDVAAAVAMGEESLPPLSYESVLEANVVQTGGVLLLGSLISSHDSDTRAHAVGALGAILAATRAMDASLETLSEMTAGQAGRIQHKDGEMVRAIVSGGGCAASVAQLILSADHSVARMGCQFLSSLVVPLLQDPAAGADLPLQYDYRSDQATVGACREAAIEIATGPCLPALMSLVRPSRTPMELRQMAAETLAATVFAVGEMGRAWSNGQYEEGLERSDAPAKFKEAIMMLNGEGIVDCAVAVLQAGGGQSLGSAKETPASRIREAAGTMLSAMTSCSAEAIMEIQNRQVISLLLVGSSDSTGASTLRGDGAPCCFGTLDAAAAVLMFAWQHSAGASNELLDRLIEVIDAGVMPYLSRVLNLKIDWDARDSPVGTMKAKAAACRLLCCLFGIALTDETAIGMRRLMDAVDSDARSYRRAERSPRNIMEAAASILQAASSRARASLVGEVSYGAHYQSALFDLVDATLLATGSMCGSSIAPGGSVGTMITGESFLQERNDSYGSRRIEICNLTCDVVVRGGRGSPALLPTMMVGGLGEGGVLSSLRLALAIAQNGTKEQHAKLAQSGIMVPISDSLRTALSSGDMYKFSAALALVRFCGPYVAAGPGGGIQSVRDAIKVATNVLTLPITPDATIDQIEKQENLKSECIAALEALSKNASLWSSISSDALPSIVRFLQMTASIGSTDPRRQKTRCAALRAVLQIVQVPSHAVSAARDGVAEALGALLQTGSFLSDTDEVPMLALEVLHVIASKPQSRKEARFIQTGMVRSICAALGKSASETPKKPSDTRADVTFLGLEILNLVLSDIQDGSSVDRVIQSPDAVAFLDMVSSEPQFLRSLCSTLLLKTNMKLPRHDAEMNGGPPYDMPKLYGPPLILVHEKCAGHEDTHHAAAALLLTSTVLACAIESKRSDIFWKTILLEDLPGKQDEDERLKIAATFSAHFLALLTVDYKPFVPADPFRKQEYVTITRPLVRHRFLEALKDSLEELSSDSSMDPYTISVLVNFNIPHVCLSLWKDPALLDLAFELIKKIVEDEPDEVLHLFVEGEAAMMSLFDLLNLDSSIETSKNVNEIRRFLASVLGQLAEGGLLAQAVQKFNVRSSAISALAAACLSEGERAPDDDEEDATSNQLSSVLMKCLVELCTVNDGFQGKKIKLSSGEAESIATNLGKKICHMVLSRFLERAKLEQYEIEDEEDIMDAPDLAMLCALAQHDEALKILRSVGGLHALSLVAGEGELMAMTALRKACASDPSILVEDNSYQPIMKFISDDAPEDASAPEKAKRMHVESAAFELVARLCSSSTKGRDAVAKSEHCADCIARAMEILSSEASLDDDDDSSEDGEDEEAEVAVEPEAEWKLTPPPDPPSYDRMVDPVGGSGQNELAVAACLLLSALAPTSLARQTLVQDDRFVRSLSALAGDTSIAELRYAGLKLVSALLPFVAGEDKASTDRLCEVLLSALTSEHKLKQTVELNANLLHGTAVDGIMIVFDYLSTEQQETAAKAVAAHFQKTVKTFTVTRSTSKQALRAHGAHLCYNLTLALLLVRGKEFMDAVFTQDLLKSFMNIIQWRSDPKTTVEKTDEKAWNASISNCLLILSLILWRPDEILVKADLNLKELASTSLMLARPGKAPRKAIDLKSALTKITESTDCAASLAASRILDRLF